MAKRAQKATKEELAHSRAVGLQWYDFTKKEWLDIKLDLAVSRFDYSRVVYLQEKNSRGEISTRIMSVEVLRRLTSDALELLSSSDRMENMRKRELELSQGLPLDDEDEDELRARTPTPGYSFGMRLRKVRKDKGMTMVAMAEALGISHVTWSAYERDKSFPAKATILLFCRLFGVREKWLVENEGSIYVDQSWPPETAP